MDHQSALALLQVIAELRLREEALKQQLATRPPPPESEPED